MKFSQKIFSVSFLLMILSMYIIGGWMVHYNHKTNIEREINRGVGENQVILSVLQEVMEERLKEQSTPSLRTPADTTNEQTKILSVMNRLIDTTKDLSIEINKNDDMFCHNTINPSYKPAPSANPKDRIGTVIRSSDSKDILYTYSNIQIHNDVYTVYTSRDITPVYAARAEQIAAFINVSLLLTLLCALVLAVMIYFVTRKIKHLQDEAEKICQGDYSAKIAIKGTDEIADLGLKFNAMIDSVNQNMNSIQQVAENRKLFISDLSHEIKSPLTSILGYSELLRNVKLTDEDKLRKYAQRIHEDGKYIEQLSASLAQMMLMGENRVERSMINLSELLKTTLIMAQDMLSVYRISFEAAVMPEIKQAADPRLIQSLVLNLLKNACRASQPGSLVKVSLDKDRLSVSDQGKGIPLEELERIREPFYQIGNKSRSRQHQKGLGLGLPLCIKIAELHGWQLIIQSKVGHGTNVIVFFNQGGTNEKL